MILAIILMVLGACSLTFFLIEKVKAYSVKATIIKSVTSLLFIVLATYSAFTSGHHIFSMFAIPALVLGLLGDIWLDFKYVYPKEDKLYTYAGFIVFALGHILYVTGMFLEFLPEGSNPLFIILPIIVGIAGGALTVLMEKPLKLEYKDMKLIVFIYACFLFTNPAVAMSLLINHSFESTSLILLFIGGVFFAISDLILSGTYFGGKERPFDIISNAITYYAAQYLIAFSIFFLI